MKYIARCKLVMGGRELEIIEVEDEDIFDTLDEAKRETKWRCI